jgi:Tfp pilus assembly protein PilE
MKTQIDQRDGSTLVVTIIVVASLLVLLGIAVQYSTQISRTTQRSRKTALAMEIADGHLETLFTNWRNIYRTTWSSQYGSNTGGTDYSLVGTNYFYTSMSAPAPAPTPVPYMSPAPGATPPVIPLPSPSIFGTSSYNVTQYRVQAVDPMITLDANGNAMVEGNSNAKGTGGYVAMSAASPPPAAYGPGASMFPYSFYYLAAVDVTVPALEGNVTAKVRRVFEKKYDVPWSYAMFYVDDLELQPTTPLTITGPVHTNGGLYIGTSNFTASSPTYGVASVVPTYGRMEYGSEYVNGYGPKDPRYPGSGFTTPNFPKSDPALSVSDCPPSQVSPYLPFGWNVKLNTGNGSASDDSYHEIIERPAQVNGADDPNDPLKSIRYYYQASYKVLIDNANNITIKDSTGAPVTSGSAYNAITGAMSGNKTLQDGRENSFVRVMDVDVAKLTKNFNPGVIYFSDTSAGTAVNQTLGGVQQSTTKRGIRLKNASTLPADLTIVCENPVYIWGDYNTGGVPPSDSGTYTSVTTSAYAHNSDGFPTTNAAIVADAINVLSGAWTDANSTAAIPTRAATPTTINAALVTGNVLSDGTNYSGGGENFIRFLEDWKNASFTYSGSLVQLWQSKQAIGPWNGAGNVYKAPKINNWFYNTNFGNASPPGNLQVAAYLQQQRWYQVY